MSFTAQTVGSASSTNRHEKRSPRSGTPGRSKRADLHSRPATHLPSNIITLLEVFAMGRPKKVDYAAMFSYDSKTGLYYCTRTIRGTKKKFRARDPKDLYDKVQAAEEAPEPVPTFAQVAEEWKEKKWPTIRYKTQECYVAPLKRALDEYGLRKIDSINAADIERIIQRMKAQGFSSQTVKDQKAVLHMIFNFAIAHDPPYLLYNPCAAVKVPRGLPKKKRDAPDDAVLKTITRSVDTVDFGLFAYLLLFTGCRRGEALALTWDDIDTQNGVIHVTKAYSFQNGRAVLGTPKTESSSRDVPLLLPLAAHLCKPETAKGSDLIFQAKGGGPLCESSFKRRWRQYCIDIGMTKITPVEKKDKAGKPYIQQRIDPALTPHQLRHGYATLIVESGTLAKYAQGWLGHADIHTTLQTYTDARERKNLRETKKFARYMKKNYS